MPEHLISLSGVASLKGIASDDSGVRIGSLTTLAEIERSEIIRKEISAAQGRGKCDGDRSRCGTSPPSAAISAAPCLPPIPRRRSSPSARRSTRGTGRGADRPRGGFFTGPKASVRKTEEILTEIVDPETGPRIVGMLPEAHAKTRHGPGPCRRCGLPHA